MGSLSGVLFRALFMALGLRQMGSVLQSEQYHVSASATACCSPCRHMGSMGPNDGPSGMIPKSVDAQQFMSFEGKLPSGMLRGAAEVRRVIRVDVMT